jgi:transcriptional regulator with XRE-family HTH domain
MEVGTDLPKMGNSGGLGNLRRAPYRPRRSPRPARQSAVFAPEYQAMLRALRAARIDAGLTLKDVAVQLGRPISFVSKSELGERRLDPVDLWRFAHLYGVGDRLPAGRAAPLSAPAAPSSRGAGTVARRPRRPGVATPAVRPALSRCESHRQQITVFTHHQHQPGGRLPGVQRRGCWCLAAGRV